MDTRSLQGLTKEELIKLVEELQLRVALQEKGVPELAIDYRKLVESASDVIFVLDQSGNIVYMNAAWEDMFRSKREDALGMHYTVILPAIEIERATQVFDAIMRGEQNIINEKFKTVDKSGNTVYVIANFSTISDEKGVITGLMCILRNITDMHLMEKKLKINSRRLEEKIKEQIEQAEELRKVKALNDEIIQTAPIGIMSLDPTGIVLSENPALKEIIGIRQDETVIGMNFSDIPGGIDVDFQKVLDEVVIQRRPHTVKNRHYRRGSADGLELTLNFKINPIFDSEKRVKSVMVMIEDVTHQARIGTRMHRVEQLSAMGLLAAGVAYELKVPINLLTVNLNFVENNIPDDSPMRDYSKSMKEEILRIKQISEQLLNLAKPEDADWEIFEAHKLITSHPIQIMLNRLQKNGYHVNTIYPENSVRIMAHRNQLIHMLLHLIANAEEAMPERGELKIIVDSVMYNGAKFATINVEDNGIGIPRDNLKKIFQPFFSTKGDKSTGLGLMVTYTIIENHGGVIAVKSQPGEGTSVRILLPSVEE